MAKKAKKERAKINRIKVELAEKDMSHKELARKVGLIPNSITSICNNESQPSLLMLGKTALVLDVDISELLISSKSS